MVSSERDRSHKKKALGDFPRTAGARKDARIQSKQSTDPDDMERKRKPWTRVDPGTFLEMSSDH